MEPNEVSAQSESSQPIDIWKAYIRILQGLEKNYPHEYEKVPPVLKCHSTKDIDKLTDRDVQALRELNALPKEEPPSVTREDLQEARIYVHTLQKLIGSNDYANIPPVLGILCHDDDAIDNLDAPHLQALILMNVFPADMFAHTHSQLSQDQQEIMRADQSLIQFCEQDPELKEFLHKHRGDPHKMMELLQHPKIQMFFATHPDLKAIVERIIQKARDQYLQAAGLPVPGTSGPIGPYRSHPYGAPDPQSNQLGFPIGLSPRSAIELTRDSAQIAAKYTEGASALMEASRRITDKLGETFRKAGG